MSRQSARAALRCAAAKKLPRESRDCSVIESTTAPTATAMATGDSKAALRGAARRGAIDLKRICSCECDCECDCETDVMCGFIASRQIASHRQMARATAEQRTAQHAVGRPSSRTKEPAHCTARRGATEGRSPEACQRSDVVLCLSLSLRIGSPRLGSARRSAARRGAPATLAF